MRLATALRSQLVQQAQGWLRAEQEAPEGEMAAVAAVAAVEMKRSPVMCLQEAPETSCVCIWRSAQCGPPGQARCQAPHSVFRKLGRL